MEEAGLIQSGRAIAVGVLVQTICAGSALAAHPLQTEDTGTQGAGNVEFENGFSRSVAGDSSVFAYQPQISYGVTPSLDLIVQPSWLRSRSGGTTARGWGDTNLDGKWRFFGEAPISLAVRAGAALATSQQGLGNPHGKATVHAVAVATVDAAPFTFHGNLGVNQNPSGVGLRSRTARISAALMWAESERLTLTADAGTESNADPSRNAWFNTILLGAIYSVLPSLDIDCGYQLGAGSGFSARQWLVGITYRFAP
jgi:hypothetical protein